MFFKNRKKKKSIFAASKYKINRNNSVRYRNPLKIKKGLFKFKLFKIVNLILIAGILGFLYFFIFSDFYNITNVEIKGNQIISTDDLLEISNTYLSDNKLFVFKNKNIFLFKRNNLINKINEVIILEEIKIEKILPNTIRITIKEKNASLKLVTGGQEYLVDSQGMIIKKFYKLITPKIFQVSPLQDNIQTTQKKDNFLKIYNKTNQGINLGDYVLKEANIDFIIKINKKLIELDYLNIEKISVPNNFPKHLIIYTKDNWQIYFNLTDDIDIQISRLEILINQKIQKGNLPYLDYIDLRLGESVYYKMK